MSKPANTPVAFMPAHDLMLGDIVQFYGERIVRDVTGPYTHEGRSVVKVVLECYDTGIRSTEVMLATKEVSILDAADA